jgi:hypothetical protein
MSILAHQQARDAASEIGAATAGFVADILPVVESLTRSLALQPKLRVVTNAGGMNPSACARQVSQILAHAGLGDVRVAAAAGDDFFDAIDQLVADGETFTNLDSGAAFETVRPRVVSANAYLGAAGIVDALGSGARVVITGRVADASLAVGPCVHEFGWRWDDWNRLAAATVAGHLIECGAQATGGMYSDWPPERRSTPGAARADAISLAPVGYPIAEIDEDASVVITKAPGTGGVVTVGAVSEQLVYEIGDPAHYLTPDLDADFRNVRLVQESTDRVRVGGAVGLPRPETYKASLSYDDGYMASATLVICGRDAESKARQCAAIVLERVRHAGYELERTHVECLGAGDSLPGVWPRPSETWEVVLRMSVHDRSRAAVERWTRELAPLVTSGPPGVTGYTGARVKPHRVLAHWPSAISRHRVFPRVIVQSAKEWIE